MDALAPPATAATTGERPPAEAGCSPQLCVASPAHGQWIKLEQCPLVVICSVGCGGARHAAAFPAARALYRILSRDPKHALKALALNRKAS